MLLDLLRANIFPAVLIVLDLCAAAEKASQHDMWGAVYWVAAAVITIAFVCGR